MINKILNGALVLCAVIFITALITLGFAIYQDRGLLDAMAYASLISIIAIMATAGLIALREIK